MEDYLVKEIDKIGQMRVESAKAYFRQGFNCSQSVVLAFKDICGMDENTLGKVAAGLGGGVGRMREVCGCVCGMAMLSGFMIERLSEAGREPKTPHEQKTAAYTLTQKMAASFKEETGSIVCRELLGLTRAVSPIPEHRSADYYRKRPCEQMVALAARIVSEALEENL